MRTRRTVLPFEGSAIGIAFGSSFLCGHAARGAIWRDSATDTMQDVATEIFLPAAETRRALMAAKPGSYPHPLHASPTG